MKMLIGIGRRPQSEEVVDLLLECHERIRRFARLAVDVGGRSDLADDEVVDGCHRCERYFAEALPLHVADEEESVLPRMWGLRPDVDQALASMRDQHAAHASRVAAVLDALRALRLAPQAAEARGALNIEASRLQRDFEEHLRLEEEVIFPALRELVSREAQALIVRELRARRQEAP
jgi:iron-sulfur cluster repair protein YtfE (RIC family)